MVIHSTLFKSLLCEAAGLSVQQAPSAGLNQGFNFILIASNPRRLEKLQMQSLWWKTVPVSSSCLTEPDTKPTN